MSSRFPWESQLDREEGLSLPAWEGRHSEDLAWRGSLRNPVPGFPVQLGLLVALGGICLFSSHPLADIPPKSSWCSITSVPYPSLLLKAHSCSWCPNHLCPLPLSSPKSPINTSFMPAQCPSANSHNTEMPTKTESQLTFNQLPLNKLLAPASPAGRQFVTCMAKTNRWGTKNHLGWAPLSPWSNTSTAATAVTNRAWHFVPNTTSKRGKSEGKTEIEKPITLIPSPTDVYGKELSSDASTKAGQELLGRDWSVPHCPLQGRALPCLNQRQRTPMIKSPH